MDTKFITDEIELVEDFLDTLKKLPELVDDEGNKKRGFKAVSSEARKKSAVLGKTLVSFRKTSVESCK